LVCRHYAIVKLKVNSMQTIENESKMILRDYLAKDRTILANERTMLACVRTALGLFSAGAGCIKFISDHLVIYYLGIVFLLISPFILIIGFVKYSQRRKKLGNIPNSNYDYYINLTNKNGKNKNE